MSIKNPLSAPPAPADSRPPLLAYRTPSTPEQREEYFSEICAYIREDGVATSDAAILAGIEWDLLVLWQEQHPDYTRRLALARTQYQHELLEEIGETTQSDGSPDWAAQTWLLKQRQTDRDEDLARTAEEAAAAAQPEPTGPPLVIMTEENLRDLQNRRMAYLAELDAADKREAEAQCRRAVPAPTPESGAQPPAPAESAAPTPLPPPPAPPGASPPGIPGIARSHPSQILNAKSSIINSVPQARADYATATEKRRFRQEEMRARWFTRKAQRRLGVS